MAPIEEPIPSGPFERFVRDRIAGYEAQGIKGAVGRVCADFGWADQMKDGGEKRLYRYRYGIAESVTGRINGPKGVRRPGKRKIVKMVEAERSVVEDALIHAGLRLEDVYKPELYPALYQDIPLEDERWCPGCQDHCTPIWGRCPWCEWVYHDSEHLRLEQAA